MSKPKSSQSITTYLPRDLYDRLEKAKAAGAIDPKEVIKAALYAALEGQLPPEKDAAYELVWCGDQQSAQARLDSVTEAGGQPLSVGVDGKGQYCLLVRWLV